MNINRLCKAWMPVGESIAARVDLYNFQLESLKKFCKNVHNGLNTSQEYTEEVELKLMEVFKDFFITPDAEAGKDALEILKTL
jgi:hypothetical protein